MWIEAVQWLLIVSLGWCLFMVYVILQKQIGSLSSRCHALEEKVSKLQTDNQFIFNQLNELFRFGESQQSKIDSIYTVRKKR